MGVRYVDPTHERNRFLRAYAAFSATSLGKALSRLILWKLDPIVLRLTGSRFGLAMFIPTALLETRGAKTGELRRNGVIYFHDGDKVTIVASHAGEPRHPGWYHNLRANPDVTFGGEPMRAEIIVDEHERDRLWKLADRVFPPYAKYRRETANVGRTIPLIQLTPQP